MLPRHSSRFAELHRGKYRDSKQISTIVICQRFRWHLALLWWFWQSRVIVCRDRSFSSIWLFESTIDDRFRQRAECSTEFIRGMKSMLIRCIFSLKWSVFLQTQPQSMFYMNSSRQMPKWPRTFHLNSILIRFKLEWQATLNHHRSYLIQRQIDEHCEKVFFTKLFFLVSLNHKWWTLSFIWNKHLFSLMPDVFDWKVHDGCNIPTKWLPFSSLTQAMRWALCVMYRLIHIKWRQLN